MKNNLLFITLLLSFVTANTAKAQDTECAFCPVPKDKTKTQLNFNATFVNHKHTVFLNKGSRMIIELYDVKDYDLLTNIDSLLKEYKKELKPFTDTMQLPPSASVRIDHSSYTDRSLKKIRIKKYPADGDIYLNKNGDVSNLKLEMDTVRILIEKALINKKNPAQKWYHPVQITFVLNTYTDIDEIIENSELQRFIDTMAIVCKPKRKVRTFDYKTTIIFHPYPSANSQYNGKARFLHYEGVATDEYGMLSWTSRNYPATFGLNVDIGAGLIRDKISPMAELMTEYRFPGQRGSKYQNILALSVTPYFLFDKSTGGSYSTYDNWFVNVELGSIVSGNNNAFKRGTIGVGYLVTPNGSYFKGTTLKAFMNFTLQKEFIISPEVIFTNDLKEVFPAITIKGFLNRAYD